MPSDRYSNQPRETATPIWTAFRALESEDDEFFQESRTIDRLEHVVKDRPLGTLNIRTRSEEIYQELENVLYENKRDPRQTPVFYKLALD